jgi:hypothetical protein
MSDKTTEVLTELLRRSGEREERLIAALEKLGTPQASTAEVLQRAQDSALAWRKGGPPQDVRELVGVARCMDATTGDVVEVPIACAIAYRPEGKGPAGTRIFEVTRLDAGPCTEVLEAEWLKANAQLIRDIEKSPVHQLEADKKRAEFIAKALYWRFRMPLFRAVIGKNPDAVTHLVRWDGSTWPIAHAGTKAAE